MDREKLNKSLKVVGIISACIFVLILLIGIGFGVWMAGMSAGVEDVNIDGADFAGFFQLFGYLASIAFVVMGVTYGLFGAAVLWAGYGLVLLAILLWKKNKKVFLAIAISLACLLLAGVGVCAVRTYLPDVPGTVSSIAYDHDPEAGYTVHIKENGEYVPYLVLDKNYQYTKNALLLRKYIIGGTNGYVIDYNGSIAKEKIYDGQLSMSDGWNNYDLTEADDFLTEEFPLRFEQEFLDTISNTALEFYNVEFDENDELIRRDMTLERKFFLLSAWEIGYDDVFDDSVKTNGKPLVYFEEQDRTGENEAGIQIPWWTRSFQYGATCCYCAVGYENELATSIGDGARFGIRPAFTIPYDTKIRKVYEEGLGEIYVFDLE